MKYTAFEADEYDKKIRQTLPYYKDFYKQVLDILTVWGKENIVWLDIGCGTGKMYETAQQKIDIREFVFADISENMLDISKNRFQKAGNHFEKAAVQEIEEYEKYDVITAVQVNHYLSEKDREQAVKNCYQALKKGGIFFSFENIAMNSEKGKQIVLQRWQDYQIANGKTFKEANEHIKRYGTEYFPITVNAHFETMQKCGFQLVELIWMSYMQAGFMGIKE